MKVSIVLFFLLSASFTGGFKTTDTIDSKANNTKITILIDNGHENILSYSELKSAIVSLEENTPLKVECHTTGKRFTSTLLSLTDLLIMPVVTNGGNFTEKEISAVKSYLRKGGGLLVLGLPYKERFHPDPLSFNPFLNFTGTKFFVRGGEGDIVHNYNAHNSNKNTILSLNKTLATNQARDFFEGVDEITAQSSSLQMINEGNFSKIMAPPFSFCTAEDYVSRRGEEMPLLLSKTISDGRFVTVGFGAAFTNYTSPYGTPWIELDDNKIFFRNLVSWLTKNEKGTTATPIPRLYVYLSLTIAGVLFPLLGIYFTREKEEKKPKEKLSTVLKRMREEEEETS